MSRAGEAILNKAGIPTYAYPDAAARVFQTMWRYSANLKALYETPQAVEDPIRRRPDLVDARSGPQGRTLLTEAESKNLLSRL